MQQNVIRIAFVAALLGALALVAYAGAPNEPAPVSIAPDLSPHPSVSRPISPARPFRRFQYRMPGPVGLYALDKNYEDKEFPETGPELTLGECLAIAVERSPTLKAARASMASTENGYRSLMNFGTVGTIISPDLDIRKQQAQRGLAAGAAEYQKAHNELVYDVTRLYYTAIYARQQEAIATDVSEYLEAMRKLIRDLLDNTTDVKQLEGLSEGKYLAVKMGLAQAQELRQEARFGRQRGAGGLAASDGCRGEVFSIPDQGY